MRSVLNFQNLGETFACTVPFFFFPKFMAREQNVKQVDKFSANASGISYDSLAQP